MATARGPAGVLVLKPGALKKMLTSPEGPIYKDVVAKCVKVQSGARRRCPTRTGRLRNSIRWYVASGPVGWVGTDVKYALAVHNGTRPHLIVPRNPNGVLAFTVGGTGPKQKGGTQVFVKWVQHPGTKGVPFLRDALFDIRGA